MLEFDAETTRLLESAYRGSHFVARRRANLEALSPRPGERIADIGCGPGYLSRALAGAVGEKGEIVAVDPSQDMRRAAAGRCADLPTVKVVDGDAFALPLADDSLDGAVSVQVFEYIDDIPRALREVGRVLRPGGRLVVGDMHWDSLVWRSGDPARMARLMTAFDGHLADRCVPETLPFLLRETGFETVAVEPQICLDRTLRGDGLPMMLLHLIPAFARSTGTVGEAEIEAWAAEQRALAQRGDFFFCLTHFVVSARKPG